MIKEEYKRLGGWLLLFFIMCFVSIGQNLFGLFDVFVHLSTLKSNNTTYTIIVTIIYTAIIVSTIGIIATLAANIFYILKKKPAALIRKVIALQAIIRIICIAVVCYSIYFALGSLNDVVWTIVKGVINIINYTAVWYSYFGKSVRVGVYTGALDDE